jgi:peptidoglycan/LPS O-acetylase OafA/YrhL
VKYRADIDGLRAVAVLSVMLYHAHAQWLPGGFVGVDVFFVISGFVVSASLAASSQPNIGGFIAEFYARRLARIVPALVCMLLVASIAATLFIPQAWLSELSDKTALYAFFGLGNWVLQNTSEPYFAPRSEFNPYTHTWTLGVEEQFYVICPLLLFVWVRARARGATNQARWPLALMMVIGAASLAGCIWASHAEPTSAFYSILFRFWELAAGVLLFQLTVTRSRENSQRAESLAALAPWAGVILLVVVMAFATPDHFPYPWAVFVVVSTVLLIAGVNAPISHPVRRALAKPVPVWIGRRSYSLYLWHWPIFVLLRWTVGLDSLAEQLAAVIATFLAASASYRIVELPLRHNAVLQRYRPVVRIAFFLLVVVSSRRLVQLLFWHRNTYSLSTVSRHADEWYTDVRMPSPDPSRRECSVALTQRDTAGGEIFDYRPSTCRGATDLRTLTVLGDSHARAYLPMLEELSAERGMRVQVYSFPGCPYLDLLMPMSERKPSGCLDFMRFASHETLASARAGDILFLPSLRQWRLGDEWATFDDLNPDSLMHSAEATARIDSATVEGADWLQPFVRKGMDVVFEAPPPIFRSPPFRCSDRFNASNPVCRGGLTERRAYLEGLRRPVVSAMTEISTRLPRVRIWDPFVVLCPADTCSTSRAGKPLFFDGDHLSAYANGLVYPSFLSMIASQEEQAVNRGR